MTAAVREPEVEVMVVSMAMAAVVVAEVAKVAAVSVEVVKVTAMAVAVSGRVAMEVVLAVAGVAKEKRSVCMNPLVDEGWEDGECTRLEPGVH